ncbi:long-chain-fatty-acid--CoA ligase 4 isoform X3 [Halyomorpha halys]|nr:long-chain-fatty-acid--CoA ligase 4 isoform X3 [Halyomorpha halys]
MDNVWVDSAIGAIKVVSFVYDVVTYPVYFVLQRPWQKKQLSRRVKAKVIAKDDKSITYRTVDSPKEVYIEMVKNNIDTMEKVLNYAVKQYGEHNCLGTRDILAEEDEVQDNGRVFKKYVMGDYKWRTFKDVNEEAAAFGRGLRLLGHQPKENVIIFGETRAEWMVAAQGCFKQNFPIVTIYSTLGEDAIAHGINETEGKIVVTTHDLLPKFRNILYKTPSVQKVIYMEDQLVKTDITGFKDGVEIIPYKTIISNGQSSNIEPTPPTKNDIAIIMYTSGSTGVPKGVLLTHTNMIATLKAFTDSVAIDSNDILLGFLPLAHVFELLSESVCLMRGTPVGYSTALTLIDSSSKIKHGAKGDAPVLRPTCLTAVPLILDRIYKGINDKVAKNTPFKRALFNFAFAYKKKWMRRGFSCPIIDKVIFGQTRKLLGGRLRAILAGGAPLSPDTHDLIRICLCDNVSQGYGLTESCSSATVMDRYDRSTGRVGAPTTGCDIRLVDWEEGNYRITDKPYPRGEIILGGDNISPGYFKNPEKTKEDFFDEDGKRWFKTGDIGEIQEDGSIKIIDRKKDLVKLQAGEYVSLGKVESQLKTCPIVENICVYGDSNKDYTVALVVPSQPHLEVIAKRLGLVNVDFDDLCINQRVEKEVLLQLVDHGKKCKLEKFEIPGAVKLCTEVWSPDMGLVTAAFKLKRKDIQARYQHEINRMYAS